MRGGEGQYVSAAPEFCWDSFADWCPGLTAWKKVPSLDHDYLSLVLNKVAIDSNCGC